MVSVRDIRRSPDDGADLLLWEEGRDETARHGFVIETSACDNPGCRTVALTGYPVHGAEGPFANIRDRVAGSSPSAFVLFDTRTGKLRFDPDRRREDVIFAAFLDDHLDETTCEILRRRWRRAKGLEDRTSWREEDWSWWEPGDLVARCEVFPDGRDLMVQDGEDAYWAIDLYCIRPGCDCRQVLLDFRAVGVSAGSLGTVNVSYDGPEPVEVRPESASRRELERLFHIFEEDEDLRGDLRRRHEEMKEVGEEIARLAGKQRGEKGSPHPVLISGTIGEAGYSVHPLLEDEDVFEEKTVDLDAERPWWQTRASPPILRAVPKIGRNDPCPCGSGKKYKRCCLKDRFT